MPAFRLTKKAREDLKSIAAVTQRLWGRTQRLRYIKQFDDAFHLLAHAPETGASCDYLLPGYRKFPNGSHVIFYRTVGASQIEIVRILHRRMDFALRLKDS